MAPKYFLLTSLFAIAAINSYDWCPQYHLIRAANVYDPSGPIFFNNTWHVFEDSCAWCHYQSSDLLHWEELSSTKFSGLTGSITAIDNDEFVAFYPQNDQSGIMRAVSNDAQLLSWTQNEMVIPNPIEINNGSKNFRDPLRPINVNGSTYIGVGSGVAPNGPGMVLWYKALNDELSKFELLGSLFNVIETYGCIDPETIVYDKDTKLKINAIECPDFFAMNDKFVLILGLFCTNEYFVGTFDANNEQFIPLSADNHDLLDYGNFYAAKSGTVAYGVNGETRRVLFGFTGWQEPTAPSECGRSHVIPRDISLSDDNMLLFDPIREIENLRGDDDNVKKGSEVQIVPDCDLVSASLPSTGNISFQVLISNDHSEFVEIGYSFGNNGYFYVDHRNCCGDDNDIVQTVAYDIDLIQEQKGLDFNVLVDRSVIETFFNRRKVITSMIDPTNSTAPDDRGIVFNATDAMVNGFNCKLKVWQLRL